MVAFHSFEYGLTRGSSPQTRPQPLSRYCCFCKAQARYRTDIPHRIIGCNSSHLMPSMRPKIHLLDIYLAVTDWYDFATYSAAVKVNTLIIIHIISAAIVRYQLTSYLPVSGQASCMVVI